MLEDGQHVPVFDYAQAPIQVTSRLVGTGGDDHLVGTPVNDASLQGLDGDDTLEGRAGDDVLVGGAGKDLLTGGEGVDQLTGGAGGDRFVDSASGLNLDSIADFGPNDTIEVTGLRLAAGVGAVDYNPLSGKTSILFEDGTSITFTLPTGIDFQALVHTEASATGGGRGQPPCFRSRYG